MKILFDAYTAPDIQLYSGIASRLDYNNNVFYIIPNNMECIQLMDKKGLHYTILGKRSNRNLIFKILENILRTIKLIRFLIREKPSLFISRSVSAGISAYLTKTKYYIFIDNDAAYIALLCTLPFANKIFMPKYINAPGIIPNSIKNKIYFYDGIEEQVYLDGRQMENIFSILQLSRRKKIIVIRPFGLSTEYDADNDSSINSILELLLSSPKVVSQYHIIVLPRTEHQKNSYQQKFGSRIIIPEKTLDGQSLLLTSTVFIGAGGTMSREAWVLGNVVFSEYKGRLLSVEKYLLSQKNYYKNFSKKDISRLEVNSKILHLNKNLINAIIEQLIQ